MNTIYDNRLLHLTHQSVSESVMSPYTPLALSASPSSSAKESRLRSSSSPDRTSRSLLSITTIDLTSVPILQAPDIRTDPVAADLSDDKNSVSLKDISQRISLLSHREEPPAAVSRSDNTGLLHVSHESGGHHSSGSDPYLGPHAATTPGLSNEVYFSGDNDNSIELPDVTQTVLGIHIPTADEILPTPIIRPAYSNATGIIPIRAVGQRSVSADRRSRSRLSNPSEAAYQTARGGASETERYAQDESQGVEQSLSTLWRDASKIAGDVTQLLDVLQDLDDPQAQLMRQVRVRCDLMYRMIGQSIITHFWCYKFLTLSTHFLQLILDRGGSKREVWMIAMAIRCARLAHSTALLSAPQRQSLAVDSLQVWAPLSYQVSCRHTG